MFAHPQVVRAVWLLSNGQAPRVASQVYRPSHTCPEGRTVIENLQVMIIVRNATIIVAVSTGSLAWARPQEMQAANDAVEHNGNLRPGETGARDDGGDGGGVGEG